MLRLMAYGMAALPCEPAIGPGGRPIDLRLLGYDLQEEVREWGGRCTVIAPGMVDTPFFDTPKPQGLRPGDVAAATVRHW